MPSAGTCPSHSSILKKATQAGAKFLRHPILDVASPSRPASSDPGRPGALPWLAFHPCVLTGACRAIEHGNVVLLENFDDDMDDITEQLLQRRLFRDSRGATFIRLGDTSLPYHPECVPRTCRSAS